MKPIQMAVMSALAGAVLAGDESASRGIVPEEVVKARPHVNPQVKAPATVVAKPKYVAVGGDVLFRASSSAKQVGVTIWRLRPGAAGDGGARILVHEDANTVEWVPERVGSATSLKEGDRVRLTVESPDAGYLYVVDRERYATGERGPAYLIFPTSRTHNGDNRVMGGKLIDIPAQDDRPNFFSLHQSRQNQTEEELTLILTQEPLEGIEIGNKALALTEERVAGWERRWGAGKVERFELSGGAGKTWTKAEQEAAADSTRRLTQEDPPPQTVYRVAVKAAEPVLVKVRLKYSASGRK